MHTIKLEDLQSVYERSTNVIVDVRPQTEFEQGHIPGSINIPFDQLKDRISEIPADKCVYIVCEKGGRSIGVTMMLARHEISACCVTSGGVKHWKEKGLPLNFVSGKEVAD